MTWGLERVSARLGASDVLRDVTLPARPSSVTVVIGGDGAGKSSSLKVLMGLLPPYKGSVGRPHKNAIGYVPATAGVYADLTVRENLAFAAAAYRLSNQAFRERQDALLDRTQLADATGRLAGHLSGGMQRKLAVACALLHAPELLVLDEPTTGVDPVSRAELWRLIDGAATHGAAVVVSTTYVNEAARAGFVVLLEEGSTLASGTPAGILGAVPGAVGASTGSERPGERAWRRGARWRAWDPAGRLPPKVVPVDPDFDDAVVVAAMAAERG